MRANEPTYANTLKECTKWISQQRGGYGGFGSTQSTIMALKALIMFAKKGAHPPEAGEITIFVEGKLIATKAFSEKDVETISTEIEKAADLFKAGATTNVEVKTTAKQAYPFALSYSYTTLTPVSAETIAEAGEGDLVYADPPYLGTHSAYSSTGFNYAEHVRLSAALLAAKARGVVCWVSGSNEQDTRNVYVGDGEAAGTAYELTARRSIGCKVASRGTKTELLIRM